MNNELSAQGPGNLHNDDIEQAIIGACMVDISGFDTAIQIIDTGAFANGRHAEIFAAMKQLQQQQQPIDLLTVAGRLRARKTIESVGGYMYLTNLTNRIATSANVEFHARLLVELQIRRETIEQAQRIIKQAQRPECDAFKLLDDLHSVGVKLNNLIRQNGSMEVGPVAASVITKLNEQREAPESAQAATHTGLKDVDEATGGWHPGDLTIIAARPGMGKTSFVLDVAKTNAERYNKATLFFSLEMSAEQLVGNLMANVGGVPKNLLRTPKKLREEQLYDLDQAALAMHDWPLFVVDSVDLSVARMRAKAKEVAMTLERRGVKLGMVVLDYIQLMTGEKSGSREQEVSGVSRGLKMLAKELGVPVVALSQLNRSVETRGGAKVPQLSDLRESGAIEQDADTVGFLYRPEYYDIMEDEQGASLRGVAEFIIAKARHGEPQTVPMRFVAKYGRFVDFGEAVLPAPSPHPDNSPDLPF